MLETGFLAVFLVPLVDGLPLPKTSPPIQVIWLFRWLILRIAQKIPWALTVLVFSLASPRSESRPPSQMMNTSFNPLHLVNTYGAFEPGRERLQLVMEGASDQVLTGKTNWKVYNFKCQPGNLYRKLCFCAHYQYRQDWQI